MRTNSRIPHALGSGSLCARRCLRGFQQQTGNVNDLDAGTAGEKYPDADAHMGSTIVDATNLEHPDGKLRIVREGVIPRDEIVRVVGAERCA